MTTRPTGPTYPPSNPVRATTVTGEGWGEGSSRDDTWKSSARATLAAPRRLRYMLPHHVHLATRVRSAPYACNVMVYCGYGRGSKLIVVQARGRRGLHMERLYVDHPRGCGGRCVILKRDTVGKVRGEMRLRRRASVHRVAKTTMNKYITVRRDTLAHTICTSPPQAL
jgi:hypothetical protein